VLKAECAGRLGAWSLCFTCRRGCYLFLPAPNFVYKTSPATEGKQGWVFTSRDYIGRDWV